MWRILDKVALIQGEAGLGAVGYRRAIPTWHNVRVSRATR